MTHSDCRQLCSQKSGCRGIPEPRRSVQLPSLWSAHQHLHLETSHMGGTESHDPCISTSHFTITITQRVDGATIHENLHPRLKKHSRHSPMTSLPSSQPSQPTIPTCLCAGIKEKPPGHPRTLLPRRVRIFISPNG